MKLEYRERITYVIYNEDYSNAGLTRDEMINAAQDILGVIGVYPVGINDEIEVSLSSLYIDIDEFMIRFKLKLNQLLNEKQLKK